MKPKYNNCRPACYSSEESSDEYDLGFAKPKRRPYIAPVARRVDYQEEFRKETALNNLEGVKAAFGHGVIVDEVSMEGFTALMTACHNGYPDIVEFLLEVGANPSFQNHELHTPLMVLCYSFSQNEEQLLQCAKILINNEVNINAADVHGYTSLMYASKCGHCSIVQELLSHGVNLNKQDSQGWTALFWAVNRGNFQAVKILVEGGARKKLLDNRGRIAYDLSSGRKDKAEIANFLRSKKLRHELAEEMTDLIDHPRINDDVDTEIGKLLANINKYNNIKTGQKYEDGAQLNLYSFLTITSEQLVECGIKYIWHRRQTLEYIKDLHLQPWSREEMVKRGRFGKPVKLDQVSSLTYINAAYLVVALQERLVFMRASSVYIKQQWCSAIAAAWAEEELDGAVMEGVLQEIATASKQLKSCHYKIKLLIRNFGAVAALVDTMDESEIIPSDLLMEKQVHERGTAMKLIVTMSSVFVIGIIAVKMYKFIR